MRFFYVKKLKNPAILCVCLLMQKDKINQFTVDTQYLKNLKASHGFFYWLTF